MSPEKLVVLARFTPQRGKLVVMFLGLVLFTMVGAYVLLTIDPEELAQTSTLVRLTLWAVLAGCPVFAADMLARIVRRVPTVVATSEGLAFCSIAGFSEPIPWREISGFQPVVMGKKLYLGIYLDDPNGTLGRLGLWARLVHAKSHAAGVPNITFRAIHLGVSPVEAAVVLEGIREKAETP